ncbi:winged helix-turn-helix domain-containing protein [Streptomyces europaeiscabiei]|nr:winged helix-turn-helix domain-containing protein [Streptomyces europaeiscabiei]MDX3580643.1 winged helix-turn-helix domain-containing protein [Streptomyces europaeiscabiei]
MLVDTDRTVELSAPDFDLLFAMARAPGRVFTRRGPLTQVWGEDFFGDERVVDVHIRTLRRAIGDDARASLLSGTLTVTCRRVPRAGCHGAISYAPDSASTRSQTRPERASSTTGRRTAPSAQRC